MPGSVKLRLHPGVLLMALGLLTLLCWGVQGFVVEGRTLAGFAAVAAGLKSGLVGPLGCTWSPQSHSANCLYR